MSNPSKPSARHWAATFLFAALGFVAGDVTAELEVGAQTLDAVRWLFGQEWFRVAATTTAMNVVLIVVVIRLWTRRLGGAPPRKAADLRKLNRWSRGD